MSQTHDRADGPWHSLSRAACETRGADVSFEHATVTLVEGDQFWLPQERRSLSLTDIAAKRGDGVVAPRGEVINHVVCFDDGTRLSLSEFRACLQAGLAHVDDAYHHVEAPEGPAAVFVPHADNGPTPRP
jgi:hypothetical protein